MNKTVSSLIASSVLATSLFAASDYYAKVNGEKITKSDVALALQDPRIDFKKLPKKVQKQVLEQIINKKLISQNAIKTGIERDATYKNALAKMKQDLAFQIWQKNQIDSMKVSDSQKIDFYNKNQSKFKVPAVLNARHILVKTNNEAKSIIRQLNSASNKQSKFIQLAKTKSIGPSGKNGGDLGSFPENKMVPEFSQAAKKLRKDTYTKTPVKTQYGYHVIYLKDKKPAQSLPYSKVKNNIEQILLGNMYNKKAKQLANKLRRNAKIVIK